jgi:uncharacterized protein (TIGR02246 family)
MHPHTRRRIPILVIAAVAILMWPLRAAGTAEDVADATRAWVAAYNSRDPGQILALYAPDAVFWGTSSPTLRDTPEAIADYFETAPGQPNARVELGAYKVRIWGETAVNSGSYTFTDLRDGQTVRRPARFSFVYRLLNGRWMIVDHHSSAQPAAPR